MYTVQGKNIRPAGPAGPTLRERVIIMSENNNWTPNPQDLGQEAPAAPEQPVYQQPQYQQPQYQQPQYQQPQYQQYPQGYYPPQQPVQPKQKGLIGTVISNALSVVLSKPIRLWALSLLNMVMTGLSNALALIPMLAMAINYNLTLGMAGIFLKGYRREEVQTEELFDGFKHGGKTFLRNACSLGWKQLLVFLWGLIPIVGPIFSLIKGYAYSFVPYLLKENHDLGAMEAPRESERMTKGYKSKMFWAEILIGVIIGAAFLVLGLLCSIPYAGILFIIITILAAICVAVLYPLFMGLVHAGFYEEIKNKQ